MVDCQDDGGGFCCHDKKRKSLFGDISDLIKN